MGKIYDRVVKRLKNQYRTNTNTKVGEPCVCPSCGDGFVKSSHDQKFCELYGDACQYYYWNIVGHEKVVTFDKIERIK